MMTEPPNIGSPIWGRGHEELVGLPLAQRRSGYALERRRYQAVTKRALWQTAASLNRD